MNESNLLLNDHLPHRSASKELLIVSCTGRAVVEICQRGALRHGRARKCPPSRPVNHQQGTSPSLHSSAVVIISREGRNNKAWDDLMWGGKTYYLLLLYRASKSGMHCLISF